MKILKTLFPKWFWISYLIIWVPFNLTPGVSSSWYYMQQRGGIGQVEWSIYVFAMFVIARVTYVILKTGVKWTLNRLTSQ